MSLSLLFIISISTAIAYLVTTSFLIASYTKKDDDDDNNNKQAHNNNVINYFILGVAICLPFAILFLPQKLEKMTYILTIVYIALNIPVARHIKSNSKEAKTKAGLAISNIIVALILICLVYYKIKQEDDNDDDIYPNSNNSDGESQPTPSSKHSDVESQSPPSKHSDGESQPSENSENVQQDDNRNEQPLDPYNLQRCFTTLKEKLATENPFLCSQPIIADVLNENKTVTDQEELLYQILKKIKESGIIQEIQANEYVKKFYFTNPQKKHVTNQYDNSFKINTLFYFLKYVQEVLTEIKNQDQGQDQTNEILKKLKNWNFNLNYDDIQKCVSGRPGFGHFVSERIRELLKYPQQK